MKSILTSFISLIFSMKKKTTKEQEEKNVKKHLLKGEIPTPAPKSLKTRYVSTDNGKVFYANENTSSKCTVFYIHGGSYEHDITTYHWRFLKKIIKNTDATLIVPAYRLIPFGTWKDAFNLFIPLYKDYVEKNPDKKIILMGDSAGGGLALALAEQIKIDNLHAPDELILLSPWVDAVMENPEIENYVKADPWLSKDALKVTAKYWADEIDCNSYQISPTFGDLKNLKNVTVFVGTKEIFYPDIIKFFNKLEKDNNNELVIGKDMLHTYLLMPIREAKRARKIVVDKILR